MHISKSQTLERHAVKYLTDQINERIAKHVFIDFYINFAMYITWFPIISVELNKLITIRLENYIEIFQLGLGRYLLHCMLNSGRFINYFGERNGKMAYNL